MLHPWTPENLDYDGRGRPFCGGCHRDRQEARRAVARAQRKERGGARKITWDRFGEFEMMRGNGFSTEDALRELGLKPESLLRQMQRHQYPRPRELNRIARRERAERTAHQTAHP